MHTIRRSINAAIPNKTGTKITIHVGVATQFDSISQNETPAKRRQHPYLQFAFCSSEHSVI